MSGGQNYLLLVMDMAKVGGPLSIVKVCTSMVCIKLGYRYISGWSPIGCESFYTNFNIPCPLLTTLYSLLLILSVTHIYILMCMRMRMCMCISLYNLEKNTNFLCWYRMHETWIIELTEIHPQQLATGTSKSESPGVPPVPGIQAIPNPFLFSVCFLMFLGYMTKCSPYQSLLGHSSFSRFSTGVSPPEKHPMS